MWQSDYMALEIHRIINTPIDSNCYIIHDKTKTDDCVIVDPGSEINNELINYITSY